jgi:hypothetical protein
MYAQWDSIQLLGPTVLVSMQTALDCGRRLHGTAKTLIMFVDVFVTSSQSMLFCEALNSRWDNDTSMSSTRPPVQAKDIQTKGSYEQDRVPCDRSRRCVFPTNCQALMKISIDTRVRGCQVYRRSMHVIIWVYHPSTRCIQILGFLRTMSLVPCDPYNKERNNQHQASRRPWRRKRKGISRESKGLFRLYAV